MAKLKLDPITSDDLTEYLDTTSDFSFEIQVLNLLIQKGFSCEHGGTYDDPSTKKPREFDIRATYRDGRNFLWLAVECKNIRTNYPLLISCLPRRQEEAFHEIMFSFEPDKVSLKERDGMYIRAMAQSSKSVKLSDHYSWYQADEPVGKSCSQVGRSPQKDIISSDSDVFDKWSQALGSANDLISLASTDGRDREDLAALSLVLPILVVPNDRLWSVSYDLVGNRTSEPKLVDRCDYFVNRYYFQPSPAGGDEMTISHLEFLTVKGLSDRIDSLKKGSYAREKSFPIEHVLSELGLRIPAN